MFEIVGILGGVIIVIAWVLETIESLRRHKSLVDLKFTFAFLLAAILLTAYSSEMQDLVFFWINIALIIILLVEVLIYLKFRKN